ncbi:MAG TPA: cob(I)yrinic acid a,c-diamide adenosyltransferase [Dissulfurispiraceae bacterium]|nr:cob(I)yrinic acid a,c-diamide adenosyltransferase [Dissulfurispiraceae bacterium]
MRENSAHRRRSTQGNHQNTGTRGQEAMRKGYVQVYTGNGKGKTTAAIGLALRAAGAGQKIFFGQFVKKKQCSEHKALERFSDLIIVQQFGTGFIRSEKANERAMAAAQKGFMAAAAAILSEEYDVVILDEINIVLHKKMIALRELLLLLDQKPAKTEVVLTGRHAPAALMRRANLVTEMKMVKHYMEAGVPARKGIEW